jgi:hypothetical protein
LRGTCTSRLARALLKSRQRRNVRPEDGIVKSGHPNGGLHGSRPPPSPHYQGGAVLGGMVAVWVPVLAGMMGCFLWEQQCRSSRISSLGGVGLGTGRLNHQHPLLAPAVPRFTVRTKNRRTGCGLAVFFGLGTQMPTPRQSADLSTIVSIELITKISVRWRVVG